jgi:hypothetical protein
MRSVVAFEYCQEAAPPADDTRTRLGDGVGSNARIAKIARERLSQLPLKPGFVAFGIQNGASRLRCT